MSFPSQPQPGARAMSQSEREGLVARYRQSLTRYFVRQGLNAPLAEDLTHDTFMRLFTLKSTDHIDNVEAYLFRTAASVRVEHHRALQVRGRYDPIVDEAWRASAAQPYCDRVVEGKEALEGLKAALADLKPRTREIFVLSRMEGLTYTQIAVRLGVTVSAIEKQMAFAIAHLIHRMRPFR